MQKIQNRKTMLRQLPQGGIVAEIGVQQGGFARSIMRRTSPRRLHLIDCWEFQTDEQYAADAANVDNQRQFANYQKVQKRFARAIRSGRVVLHKGYSAPTLNTFPDHYFDWVYVDANHTYEGAKDDLEAALPKLKSGGIIAGHDYIDTTYWREMNFGVVAAVDEFCERHGWELIYLTEGEGWDVDGNENPSFALRQKEHSSVESQANWWPWRGSRHLSRKEVLRRLRMLDSKTDS